jgi:glutathione peroxidase
MQRPLPAILLAALAALLAAGCRTRPAPQEGSTKPMTESPASADVYSLTATRIDGQPEALSAYRGKVTLVVNVASQCGFTPQYDGLEKLYAAYKDRGFVILGFPSDDFGGQEPGSEKEILEFTRSKYGVTFPLFAKVHAKGDGVSPVFAAVSEKGAPKWNFYKYLVGKDGKVIASFSSRTKPDDADLVQAIEQALAAKE